MNTNSVLFWDFRSLHKQIFSNCMRRLSIVDCFFVFAFTFPFSYSSRKISLKQSEISSLYSFDSIIFIHQFSIRHLSNLFILF